MKFVQFYSLNVKNLYFQWRTFSKLSILNASVESDVDFEMMRWHTYYDLIYQKELLLRTRFSLIHIACIAFLSSLVDVPITFAKHFFFRSVFTVPLTDQLPTQLYLHIIFWIFSSHTARTLCVKEVFSICYIDHTARSRSINVKCGCAVAAVRVSVCEREEHTNSFSRTVCQRSMVQTDRAQPPQRNRNHRHSSVSEIPSCELLQILLQLKYSVQFSVVNAFG